ncbi:MAG TPA: LysE family transporter [Candidatus Competibacteraceae bacterium]|nr:LysE family transporter [Candidatus Competibacteraceae bacterium]
MSMLWAQFLTVVVVHFLAVASPGPDFAVVLRQSLTLGRRRAVQTSLGVGAGILVHVAYSLLGLGLIIQQSLVAFTVLKVVGAVYLLYVGIHCLRARPGALSLAEGGGVRRQSGWQAFRLGFLTNVLNPKVTLFFVALFSVVIRPDTPLGWQLAYGLWMSVATAAWFVALSLVFSRTEVRRAFGCFGHWVERVMGVALVGLAARLALSSSQ